MTTVATTGPTGPTDLTGLTGPISVAGSTTGPSDTSVFEKIESEVRMYCRTFPVVFERAKGALLHTDDGHAFIDFFCGAGSLNYGHNHDALKRRIVDYLAGDGLMHGLDLHTVAKRDFLTRFTEVVLQPRGLDFKVQFTGPTGTDAVEAALKLARRATGRTGLTAFTGAYHGMSRGALEVTGSRRARRAGTIAGGDVTFVPFEDGPLGPFDSIGLIERLWSDPSSGTELPAAVVVEAVQMEGGVYPASREWLRRLREVTERHGVLLILDEIQTGCGRTGTFFGFEESGIVPDVVTVSKSLSGYGLPLSLTLFRRELDLWQPGEHTGTFRGNQLAFVAATAACELWQRDGFLAGLRRNTERLTRFRADAGALDPDLVLRGRGMVLGVDTARAGGAERAGRVQRHAFEHGLIVERCGRHDEVLKVMPPLTIDPGPLDEGLGILLDALRAG